MGVAHYLALTGGRHAENLVPLVQWTLKNLSTLSLSRVPGVAASERAAYGLALHALRAAARLVDPAVAVALRGAVFSMGSQALDHVVAATQAAAQAVAGAPGLPHGAASGDEFTTRLFEVHLPILRGVLAAIHDAAVPWTDDSLEGTPRQRCASCSRPARRCTRVHPALTRSRGRRGRRGGRRDEPTAFATLLDKAAALSTIDAQAKLDRDHRGLTDASKTDEGLNQVLTVNSAEGFALNTSAFLNLALLRAYVARHPQARVSAVVCGGGVRSQRPRRARPLGVSAYNCRCARAFASVSTVGLGPSESAAAAGEGDAVPNPNSTGAAQVPLDFAAPLPPASPPPQKKLGAPNEGP